MTCAGLLLAYAALALAALRLALSHRSALHALRRLWRWAEEQTQAYQLHEVPRRLRGLDQDNPLFRKAAAYVSSLPSLEDADAVSVLSSSAKKTHGGFSLRLGPGHTARDAFLGARLAWTCLAREDGEEDTLVLRVRRHDRARVLRPYLQHVESVADEMELRRRELRLFVNAGCGVVDGAPRWASAPFAHPATLDVVAMDPELKARVRADLEGFAKGRAYYHRLGRVWRRSYLLHGPPGTGKSTFAAAMARFLGYDVYDVDLSRADVDLRALLMRTTPRSLILVEDLDRHLQLQGDGAEARVLSFMDGVASCCGEERVMVFTMRGGGDAAGAAGRAHPVHALRLRGLQGAGRQLPGAHGPQAVPAGGGGLQRRRRAPPQPGRAGRDHARQPRVPEPRAPHRHHEAPAPARVGRTGRAHANSAAADAAQADHELVRGRAVGRGGDGGGGDDGVRGRRDVGQGRCADAGVEEAVRADQDQEPQGGLRGRAVGGRRGDGGGERALVRIRQQPRHGAVNFG